MRSALGVLVIAFGGVALADEKEVIVAVEPAFALMHVNSSTAWGGGAGLDLSYGVTDAVAIRATGAFTGHSLEATTGGPAGTLLAWHAGLGLTYTIDIVRVVPYIDFAVGVMGTERPAPAGATVTNNQLGVEIGVGVDYLISRRWAVGVVVRYHAFLTALSDIPVYFYAGPRIAMHFGG